MELDILQRCAIFEFIPVSKAPDPEIPDQSSLYAAYIVSGLFALAVIVFVVRRKYTYMQNVKELERTSSMHLEKDELANNSLQRTSVSLPATLVSPDDRQRSQSSPREMVEVGDLDVDVDFMNDSILTTMLGIEQLPSFLLPVSPPDPNQSISPMPSSIPEDSRRPVSSPNLPRSPNGRRRSQVKNFALELQSNSNEPPQKFQSTVQGRQPSSKSLSPTPKPLETSSELSSRSEKALAAKLGLELTRTSVGKNVETTGNSTVHDGSPTAVSKASAVSGTSRVQRVLRDADDHSSPPRGRQDTAGVLSPEFSPIQIPTAVAASAFVSIPRDRIKSSDTIQIPAIEKAASFRFVNMKFGRFHSDFL
jgi:hypothetical protein